MGGFMLLTVTVFVARSAVQSAPGHEGWPTIVKPTRVNRKEPILELAPALLSFLTVTVTGTGVYTCPS